MTHRNPYDMYFEDALSLLKGGALVDRVVQYINSIEDEDYRDGTFGRMGGWPMLPESVHS